MTNMSQQERLERIQEEAAHAAAHFSLNRAVRVDPEGRWVMIEQFPLPRGYNYEETSILILLPPDYPLTVRDWFYLDPGIERLDGRQLPHYRTPDEDELEAAGWKAGCLHIRSWRPAENFWEGHCLLTICRLIYMALERWLRE